MTCRAWSLHSVASRMASRSSVMVAAAAGSTPSLSWLSSGERRRKQPTSPFSGLRISWHL